VYGVVLVEELVRTAFGDVQRWGVVCEQGNGFDDLLVDLDTDGVGFGVV
jgi:hypothetical protein